MVGRDAEVWLVRGPRQALNGVERLEVLVTKPEVQLMRELMDEALRKDADALGIRVPILVKKDAGFYAIDFAGLYERFLELEG